MATRPVDTARTRPASTLPLIERGDLLAALDRASARKVTIISAPAGSGKSSLLRSWAARPGQRRRLAVVPVERGQDAQQFWLALLGAVRQATGTAVGAQPPAATPEFNGQAIVDRALDELSGASGDIVVVIDDLHELHSADALAQLTRLLTNLPARARAVLATRRDLRLRLHQLRLAGELTELRAADLRFTDRETRALLAASGITLTDAGVARLHERTEGWAAGLRLAAISLAGHRDPERFVAEFSGSDRTVAEYLIDEMLERQPDDVRQLLCRTSLLDRVNGELADLLTGRTGSLAEAHAEVAPPDRQRRLQLAIAAVRLSLARRRGHLASVLEQAECLTAPLSGQCDEDIALDSGLRALALLNLGTVEAWSLGLPDAERHLREGAELARKIGRPYLEVGCLAQLGFAAKIHPITITQARCREAITLAERYGWGSEWVIAPALLTLAAAVIWTGDLDQGERLLQRAAQALLADTGPDIRLLMHIVGGMLQAGRGRPQQALEEFSAAERLRAQLVGSHALGNKVTAWLLATQARLGLAGEARAALAALDDERASSGEIGNAAAAIALAEGDPDRLPGAAGGAAAARERAPRAADRHPRRAARRVPGGRRPAPVAAGRGAQHRGTAGAALPADEPVEAGDRDRAIGLAEHRQHADPQHLRQAAGP
jgi:ATP/maltotriose-dependent transcriptional regulator MalT